jgi:membrane protein implicated in regulation of membrane protease activity
MRASAAWHFDGASWLARGRAYLPSRLSLRHVRWVWACLLLAPLTGLAAALFLYGFAPAGFEGRFEGRLWPLAGGGREIGWLLAAAIAPYLVYRRLRRRLDPCQRLVRSAAAGVGYRGPAPEIVVPVPEAKPRYLPLYLLRLGLASLLLSPLLVPTDYWSYFCHIGCACELPTTRSTLQIMLVMGLSAVVLALHAPTHRTVFAAPRTNRSP